jgi:hypothetical protein
MRKMNCHSELKMKIGYLIGPDSKGNENLAESKAVEILLHRWPQQTATLAVRTCEQFVDARGLKKLFGRTTQSVKYTFAVLGIIESLLTVLIVESVSFKRVIPTFVENECEKVRMLVEMCDFVSNQQAETDGVDSAFEALTKCCASIVVLFGFSMEVVQLAIIKEVNRSEVIDLEMVIETAELRDEESTEIGKRIQTGVKLLKQITAET